MLNARKKAGKNEKREKEKRETGRKTRVGPLIEITEKPLIPYGHLKMRNGEYRDYLEVTLPKDFLRLNSLDVRPPAIRKQSRLVNLYFSPLCKGYLLLSLGQWPALSENKSHARNGQSTQRPNVTLNLEDIKNEMQDTFLTAATVSYLREEIFARIEQGEEEIVVKAKDMDDFEIVEKVIRTTMEPAGTFASISSDTTECAITISLRDNPKEIDQLREVDIFELEKLTLHMLGQVKVLLNVGISVLEKLRKDEKERVAGTEVIKRLPGKEAYIDFLWAYNCRQLIRAGRYGLFCGTGTYTPVTPVALGSFYKLLEHAVDQIMVILTLVNRCVRLGKLDDNSNQFVSELIRQLRQALDRLGVVEEPLLNAIKNKPGSMDRKKIAQELKEYHEKVRSFVGTGGETYLRGAEEPSKKMESMLDGVDGKRLLFLAQTLHPLQQLCKFPANVAMLARILCYSC